MIERIAHFDPRDTPRENMLQVVGVLRGAVTRLTTMIALPTDIRTLISHILQYTSVPSFNRYFDQVDNLRRLCELTFRANPDYDVDEDLPVDDLFCMAMDCYCEMLDNGTWMVHTHHDSAFICWNCGEEGHCKIMLQPNCNGICQSMFSTTGS